MRLLLLGLPRSGTTWISNVLAAAPEVRYVHEPDNKELFPAAHVAARRVGWLPDLRPGERDRSFERLWEVAFRGGWPEDRFTRRADRIVFDPRVPRRARVGVQTLALARAARRPAIGRHQLVKTVRSYLAAEWIADRYGPRVVVAWRNPLNTISSWQQQGWSGLTLLKTRAARRFEGTCVWDDRLSEDPTAAAAWGVCANLTLLLESALRNPSWSVVQHERLCQDAEPGFRELLDTLGLEWSPAVEAELRRADAPGSGWVAKRRRSEEQEVWRRRLPPQQQRVALAVIERFAGLSDPFGAFSGALSGEPLALAT